ncbi:MAG: adenylosuccinate synthase [Sumerlaeia bacterium]
MPATVVIGCQWGDEGKGKIVDFLAADSDVVARFQGGSNAGHTVIVNGKKFVLHALPSGVLRPGVRNIVGNGMVVDVLGLAGEIDKLLEQGMDIADRLTLSEQAHMVLPLHKELDHAAEHQKGGRKIGTTLRGIGQTYSDKFRRVGLRLGDLRRRDQFVKKYRALAEFHGEFLRKVYEIQPANTEQALEQLTACADRLAPLVGDTVALVNESLARGENVLCEGAQGVMLDIDHGTYPYVTSSSPTPGGACTGLGISPRHIERVVGVFKAYTTRVGEGPFPTELLGAEGERLREAGGEYGATTGRARRCGWLDLPVVRRAVQICGCTEMVVTKLDVLDDFDTVEVCDRYILADASEAELIPFGADAVEASRPSYETHQGWKCQTSNAKTTEDLPVEALRYLDRVSHALDTPISMVSIGPDREQTLPMK